MCAAFRVGEELIVRVPRHRYGVERLRFEVGLLDIVQSRTTIPTPEVVDVALDVAVGHAYVAHRRLPGHVLRRGEVQKLSAARVGRIGEAVGRFLRELHAVPHQDLPGVPVVTAAQFAEQMRAEVQAKLAPIVSTGHLAGIADTLSMLATVPDTPMAFSHTDIGGNILVDERDRVAIIDFGDCCLTHPAFDVASLAVLGDDLVDTAAVAYPVLCELDAEARVVAATFALQEALISARQDDWASVAVLLDTSSIG